MKQTGTRSQELKTTQHDNIEVQIFNQEMRQFSKENKQYLMHKLLSITP